MWSDFCYVVDYIFFAASVEDLISDASYAMSLFASVELTINVTRSVLVPSQEVEFWGFFSLLSHGCHSAFQENG